MQTSLGAPGSVSGFFTLFRPVSFNSDKRPYRARRVFAAAIGALVLGLGAPEASAQSVEVTASPASFSSAGQTVMLSYLFKSGVFIIDSFSVTSNLPGVAVSCPVSSLPIRSQTTCTATYTVTPGNVSAGSFTEQAAYVAVSDNGTDLSGASLPLTVPYDFATATRLTTSGSPSIFGQSVDFTATVTSNNGGTPTGNVVFSDTSGTLDTIALDFTGKAVFTTSTLSVGSHDITAAYQGDGTYQASVSAPRRQVVNKANAAAGLNFPVSVVVGTPVDLQAILSGDNGTPTGQVTFKDNGSVLATKTLDASGRATLTVSDFTVGDHTISFDYSGDSTYKARSFTGSPKLTVEMAEPSVEIESSRNPSRLGEEITFKALVGAASGGTPQGEVTFLNDAISLGAVPLSNGMAELTTGALSRATHQITAVYSGDENFLAAVSDPLEQVVERGDTSTALASTGNTVTGQQATFTATVSVDPPAMGTPTGTVSFYADGDKLGTTGVSAGGSASLAVADLPVGGHTVTAAYDGDGNFNTSRSADLAHVVDPGETRTALSSGGNTVSGEQAAFTIKLAAMAPAVGTPTGRVVLFAGATKLGSARLDAGKATIRTAQLAAGRNDIVAEYRGDDGFAASTSDTWSHTVRKGETVVKLTSSAEAAPAGPPDLDALPGEDIVFSVKVKPRSPAAGTPDGMVELRHGGAIVETAKLDGGVAAFTRAFETGGHTIAIAYRGSDAWKSASSDGLMLAIDPRAKEFQVNTTVKQAQRDAAIAGLDNGTFVAVWSSKGQDGSGRSLHMQRFKKTASGKVKKSGKEAQVNSHTPADQADGVVAGVKKASWFAAWESVDQDAASLGEDQSTGIYMQRYRANGKPDGGEMRVNVETMLDQTDVALAGLGGKAIAAAWVSQDQDGDGTGIYARLFKADGTPKTGDILVNDDVLGDQAEPAIAGLSGDGVAVAFRTPDADGTGIAMRLFDKSGNAKGKMKRVNTETAEDQTEPAIAGLKNGDFIVSWSSHKQDGAQTGIFAQRFTAKGKARGGEIQVNTTTEMAQAQSHITALTDGGFLISWHSQGQDGSGSGVYAQRFIAKGKAKGVEFRVNQTVKHDQTEPALTTLPDGSVIAAWTSDRQDGAKHGIFGIKLDFADAVGDTVAGRAR